MLAAIGTAAAVLLALFVFDASIERRRRARMRERARLVTERQYRASRFPREKWEPRPLVLKVFKHAAVGPTEIPNSRFLWALADPLKDAEEGAA